MQVFVPVDYSDRVREAIGEAGGGKMGNYSYCMSVSKSIGYFLPMDGANPAIGKIGTLEKVDEEKLEFICDYSQLKTVVEAIKRVHPYEEVAMDITPLLEMEN